MKHKTIILAFVLVSCAILVLLNINKFKDFVGLRDLSDQQTNTGIKLTTSPEMRFGLDGLKNLGQKPYTEPTQYFYPNRVDLNIFALEGTWKFENDKAVLVAGPGKIKLHFYGQRVQLEAKSQTQQSITAKVGDQPTKIVSVAEKLLYNLHETEIPSQQLMEILIPKSGFEAFSFTFE